MVAFVAALQHLLAIIVPIVTPGLLICQALGVSSRDTTLIVSMSLVISGIATFVQCKRFGPLGAGLLIVRGTSFNFVGPLIAGGSLMVKQGTPVETVMAAIFGVVMAGSFVEMGVSRILPFVKRLITPLVTGIVVLLIGLTLIKVGLISMGGGFGAMAKGTFASAENLTLSGLVLGTIILLNRVPIVWVRSTALVIALVIGYLAAAFLGRLDFTGMHQAALFQVPTPLHFGIGFVGAVRADADHLPRHVARGDRRRHGHQQDLERAGRRPGVDAADQGRRARERRELAAGRRVQHVPELGVRAEQRRDPDHRRRQPLRRHLDRGDARGARPVPGRRRRAAGRAGLVLGGAAMVMFGAVAASGINILAGVHLDRRALLIIAVSLALGLGVSQVPDILNSLPHALKNVLESGVATGGICALVMNWFLPEKK